MRDYLPSPAVSSTSAIPPSWSPLAAPKARSSLSGLREIYDSPELEPNRPLLFAYAMLIVAQEKWRLAIYTT